MVSGFPLPLSSLQAGLSEEQVCQRQRSLMAGLPEFGVKDMASWFRFVVLSRPILLQGLQVNLLRLYFVRALYVLSVSSLCAIPCYASGGA